jgi:hypothetical protein
MRADVALQALLGISRFPGDDTIRNLFKRFGQGQCQHFFSGLWSWQLERLPEWGHGYSLDLDSTVFERYGRQQCALRGPNPRKHGRPSHHPLVAVLAEAHFLLQGWLRSGNCGLLTHVAHVTQNFPDSIAVCLACLKLYHNRGTVFVFGCDINPARFNHFLLAAISDFQPLFKLFDV